MLVLTIIYSRLLINCKKQLTHNLYVLKYYNQYLIYMNILISYIIQFDGHKA